MNTNSPHDESSRGGTSYDGASRGGGAHRDASDARPVEAAWLARITDELVRLDEAPLSEDELASLRGIVTPGDPADDVTRGHAGRDLAVVEALIRLAALHEVEDAQGGPPPAMVQTALDRVAARLAGTVIGPGSMAQGSLASPATPSQGVEVGVEPTDPQAKLHALDARRRLKPVLVLIAAAAAIAISLFVVRERLPSDRGVALHSGSEAIAALGGDARDALQALGYDPATASARLTARAAAWAEALAAEPGDGSSRGGAR
jgi:hypothetical protein